jgi:sugar lactone lactonase YvrE
LVHPSDAGFAYAPVAMAPAADAGLPPQDAAAAHPSLTLVAGTPGGRGDLDGAGADVRIGLAGGMARVGDDVLFADEGNGTIRRFTPKAGTVETLARFPAPPAGRPSLPAYVAWDGKGTLYATDRSAQVVYALDLASRALSPVAGKLGVRGADDGAFDAATFDAPTGLAFDGDHTLYVADVGNRHVRALDLAAKSVRTLPAQYLQVWGLCFAGGALYASDNLNEAIFRVDPRSGDATLIAGSGRFGYFGSTDGVGRKAGFREPRGLECAPGALYVADRGNGTVRRLDLTTMKASTLAGRGGGDLGFGDGFAKDARFEDIQSVIAWDDGTLLVGEESTIRSVDPARAEVRTVAGSPDQMVVAMEERTAILHPEGIALAPAEGVAYVATCGSSSVQRVDLSTGATSTLAGSVMGAGFSDDTGTGGRFHCLSTIAYDGSGNVFVGDRDNHAVRAVRADTRRVTTVAGSFSKCGGDDGPFQKATFCDPSGMAFADGQLFVSDAATSTIRRVDLAARTVSTLAGAAFETGAADGGAKTARFSSPVGLAYAGGALYVADRENGVVRRVDARTGDVSTLPGARFERPRAIALAAGGAALLVADARGVYRVPLAGGERVAVVPAGDGLRLGAASPEISVPSAIVEVAPGDALVLDRAENALVRLRY